MNAIGTVLQRLLHASFRVVFWCCAAIGLAGGTGCATVGEMMVTAAAPPGALDSMKQMETLTVLSGVLAAQASLKPGEYARYRISAGASEGSSAGTFEWANLGRDPQGFQWSRIKYTGSSSTGAITIETGTSQDG